MPLAIDWRHREIGRKKERLDERRAVATKKKEVHRSSLRGESENYKQIAAEHANELERVRRRTAELRAQRLAQERRGKKRVTLQNARLARSPTKTPTE